MRHVIAPLLLMSLVALAASCKAPATTVDGTGKPVGGASMPVDKYGEAPPAFGTWTEQADGSRLFTPASPAMDPNGPSIKFTWRETELELQAFPNDNKVEWVNYYIQKGGNKDDFYSVESTSRFNNFKVTIYRGRFYPGKWQVRAFAQSNVEHFARYAFWMPYPSQEKEGKTEPWFVDWDADTFMEGIDRPVNI